MVVFFAFILVIVSLITLVLTWIPKDPQIQIAEHTFQTDLFKSKSGFKYYDDDRYESIIGVDVSDNQSYVNWKQVKKSGVSFAMIRCGYRGRVNGKMHEDTHFEKNIKNAAANDLDIGVYYFSSAITKKEAVQEARYVLRKIKDHDVTYPVAFDMEHQDNKEVRIDTLTKHQKTEIAKAFCKEIEDHGYQAMIYGNANWLTWDIDLDALKNYDIWYAGYQDKPDIARFSIWQYSDSGKLPGVQTDIDMNIYVKKKDD